MKKIYLFLTLLVTLCLAGTVQAQTTLTVHDGEATSQIIPFYGWNADHAQYNQILYPASDLSAMNGMEITQMVFYFNSDYGSNSSSVETGSLGNWTISLGETTASTLTSTNTSTSLSQVYQGIMAWDHTALTLTITFDNGYVYNGGNLLIEFDHSAASGYNRYYFLGDETSDPASFNSYTYTSYNFLPKLTFSYRTPPTCSKPTNVTLSFVNNQMAYFTWDEVPGANWQIDNVEYGETPAWTGSTIANHEGGTTGLTATTHYDFYVRQYCSATDQSEPVKVSYWTKCDPITTFPWNEDFENMTSSTVPDCWDNSASTSYTLSSNPEHIWGVYNYNSNNMLRMYNYFVKSGTALINSPIIALPSEGEYQLTFNYSHLANCGDFTVKISEDGGTTFANLGTYSQTSSSTNQTDPGEFTEAIPISLSAYAGKSVILQFNANANFGSGAIFVDDITIDLAPACSKPTGFHVVEGSLTAHTVTVEWDAEEGAMYQAVMPSGTFDPSTPPTSWNVQEQAQNTDSWSYLTPDHNYGVWLRKWCSETDQSEPVYVTFHTPIACLPPSDLTATLTSGNGTVADLSWTENGTATNWVLEYGTADDFTGATSVNVSGTASQQLTGLTPETLYYARVKADCGSADGQSEWSTVTTFTPTNTYFILVNDSIATNNYVPVYGYYCDNYSMSQFIIPAAKLAAVQYGTIDKLTFYSSNANISWGDATFKVYLSETSESTISELTDWDNLEVVYTGTLYINDYEMVIALDNPYQYLGGNLLVGVNQTVSGSYTTCTWYGVLAPGASIGGYNNSLYQQNFLPKTYIEYTPGTAPACLKPTNLQVAYTDGTTATVTWDSEATSFNIDVNGTVTNNVTSPYTLSNLEYGTSYDVKVQTDCGTNGTSEWTNEKNFVTDLCAPDNQCNITFELTDNFGDGWNGNAIRVVDILTGIVLGEFSNNSTIANEPQTYTHAVCNGREIQFQWVVGNYPDEASYTVYDANGAVIFSGTDAMAAPVNFTVNCSSNSCQMPTNFAADNVTENSATITWTDPNNLTTPEFLIRYYGGGIDTWASSNTAAYTLNDLTPNTEYTIEVYTRCSVDETSEAATYTFTTAAGAVVCDAIVVTEENPFTEGFEGTTMPDCWTLIADVATNDVWTLNEDPTETHTGTGCAFASYNEYNYISKYLITPALTLPSDAPTQLSFWSYNIFPDDYGKNSVLVSTTGTNPTDFTEIWSPTSVDDEWDSTGLSLSDYAGQTIYIAFKYEGEYAHDWLLDDITVRVNNEIPVPSCENWELVTDNSLEVGDQIVIASLEQNVAMSTTQNDNNRGVDIVTKNTDNTLGLPLDEAIQILTLEEGTSAGTFALYTGEGYLYAASSSGNQLKTKTSLDANGSWTISISSDGTASIVANGSNSRKFMQYNQNNSIISCYASANQSPLAIYKLTSLRSYSDTTATVAGTEFAWHGKTYYESGVYGDTLTGAAADGCDSVVVLHLTLVTPSYTVTFEPGTGTCATTELTESTGGEGISLPEATACTNPDGYVFAGWSEDNITVATSTRPSLYPEGYWYHPSENTTLYAVYESITISESDPVLSKSSSIYNGDQVIIVCESASKELGNMSSTSTNGPAVGYTGEPQGAYLLTVSEGSTTGTYSFMDEDGNYLYWNSGNELRLNTSKTAKSSWNVTFDSDGNAIIKNAGDNTRMLQYNSGNPRFACYTSASNQTAVQLYNLISTATITRSYYSTPECGELTFNITATVNPVDAGMVDGTGQYEYNAEATLTAAASEGYLFSNWTLDGTEVSTSDVLTFTVTEDAAYVANFVAMDTVATPTFAPEAGTYTSEELSEVTISCATDGAAIYYTTDGTTPTTSSTVYNTPIAITGTTTIKAIATAANMIQSKVGEATYTINPVYNVTISSSIANGSVTADPVKGIEGTEITLTATPVTGYHFGQWNVVDADNSPVTVTNDAFEMPASDVTVSAIFWIDTLNITATVNPTNAGSVTGAGQYEYNANVTLSASAMEGYLFDNWTLNGESVSSNDELTFTATEDAAYIANFVVMGQVSAPTFTPAAGEFDSENIPEITISCATAGATIYYTTDGTTPTATSTVYSTPINITGTTTVKAVAMATDMIPSEVTEATYTINQVYNVNIATPIDNGTVTADPVKGIEGTEITLTATPATGYHFGQWNVVDANNTPVTVTGNIFEMPASDVTVSTIFWIDTLNITATVNPANAGLVEGTGEFEYGSNATLVATPNEGFLFSNWTLNGDVVSSNNIYDIIYIEEDAAYVANFVAMDTVATPTFAPEAGTYTSEELSEVTISCATDGATIYYTTDGTTPTEASTVYNAPVSVTGTTTIKAIATAANMIQSKVGEATYTINPVYNVTISTSIANGSVTADPVKGIEGTEITLTATPATGYHFGQWNVVDANNTPVTVTGNIFEMPASDVTVSAIFWIDTLNITATVNPSNAGLVEGTGEFEYGSDATLVATPNEGFLFSNWTLNGQEVSTNNIYDIIFIEEDAAYVANFVAMETVSTPVITPNGGTFNSENIPEITISCATEVATIYYTTDGSEPTENSPVYGNDPITITGTTTIKAIAVAEDMLPSEVATATFTINPVYNVLFEDIMHGIATADTLKGVEGDVITLTATPDDGYFLKQWDVLNNTTDESITVTDNTFEMPASDVTVNAVFVPDTFTVTVVSDPEAGGTIISGAGRYAYDEEVNIVFEANPGYELFYIGTTVEGGDEEESDDQFSMPAGNVTVTLHFVPATYSLTLEVGQGTLLNGFVRDNEYTFGQGFTLPTADDVEYTGHSFGGWYSNFNFEGDPITAISTDAYGDTTVYAKWIQNEYTLTIHYLYPDNSQAHEDVVSTYTVGSDYSVASPTIATYMPDQVVVSGTMGNSAVEVTVNYILVEMNAVDDITICNGGFVPATAFSSSMNIGEMSYAWTSDTQLPINNGADEGEGDIEAFQIVTMIEEPAVVTITVTPTCTYQGMEVTGVPQVYTITVNPSLTSEFSIVACDEYRWIEANMNIRVEGTHDYVYHFETAEGCDSIVTLHLTLYKSPADVVADVTENTSCNADQPNGTLTVTAPVGENYEYSLDEENWQSETEFTGLAAGTYNVSARTVGSECAKTIAVVVSDNIVMPVVTASTTNTFYCVNGTITLTGEVTPASDDYEYAWTGPNNYTANVLNPDAMTATGAAQSGTYTLTVTNPETNCTAEATVDVIVNEPNTAGYFFTVTINGDAYANINEGETEATVVLADPTVQHYLSDCNWTLTNNSDENTYNAVGDYTVTWTATDECGNTATANQTVHVTQGACSTPVDGNNNSYPTVQMNGHCWMAANLKATKYSDGRDITGVYRYQSPTAPNVDDNVSIYGLLYDWYAAMDVERPTRGLNVQGACPTGWHIPDDDDFAAISSIDLYSLRSTNYWLTNAGDNSTGYNMLPAGQYNDDNSRYENLLGNAYFWSATATTESEAQCHMADCNCSMWYIYPSSKFYGYSIRCVKNE